MLIGSLQEINPEAVYTIVTIDYLYKLNSGAYAVLQEGKNVTPLEHHDQRCRDELCKGGNGSWPPHPIAN